MARLVWRTGDDQDWLVEPKPAGSALVVQQRDEDQWGRIERTRRLRVFAQRDRLDQRYGCPCLSVVGGPGPACRAAEETGSEVDQRRHRWFACANRVCCVFISQSFPDSPLFPLGEVLAESSRHAERTSHWRDQPHNDWQHTKAVAASSWPSLATSATSPFRFRDQHGVCQRRFGATYRASSRTLGAHSTTRREIA